VYLWFVRLGHEVLELSFYYDTDDCEPAIAQGHTHMYTGSAYDLRFRIGQHLKTETPDSSSPRKSLLALEHMFSVVTQIYGSKYGELKAGGLTEWIYQNVIFGFELSDEPIARERFLIQEMASPFNIAHRRQHKYSKYLMAWRAIAFPSEWMKTIPLGRPGSPEGVGRDHAIGLAAAVNVK
jgi:hypothetical protein